jgi:hypothetical protein
MADLFDRCLETAVASRHPTCPEHADTHAVRTSYSFRLHFVSASTEDPSHVGISIIS